jgi:hypothetical protein
MVSVYQTSLQLAETGCQSKPTRMGRLGFEPRLDQAFSGNAQLFPRQKLTAEQPKMAMQLESSRGKRAFWIRTRIRARFPSMETNPLER